MHTSPAAVSCFFMLSCAFHCVFAANDSFKSYTSFCPLSFPPPTRVDAHTQTLRTLTNRLWKDIRRLHFRLAQCISTSLFKENNFIIIVHFPQSQVRHGVLVSWTQAFAHTYVPHVTSVWKCSEVIRKPQTRFLLYNIFLSRNTYRHNALFLLSHTNIILNMNILDACRCWIFVQISTVFSFFIFFSNRYFEVFLCFRQTLGLVQFHSH